MYRKREFISIIYLCIDIFLITVSFDVPYGLRFSNGLVPKANFFLNGDIFFFVLWGITLVIFLQFKELYSTDRSLTIPKEIRRVFVCVAASSIVACMLIFVLQLKFFSRLEVAGDSLFLFFSLSFWRTIKRAFIRYRLARGFYNINVLIIGAGEQGLTLAQEFKRQHHLGRTIAGFFDFHKTGKVEEYIIFSGNIEELKDLIRKHFIGEIYITTTLHRHLVLQIISIGRTTNTSVNILLDKYSTMLSQGAPTNIGLHTFFNYTDTLPHTTDLLAKRGMDIIVSIVGLVVFWPVFIIVGILIKLESPGPVFYKSRRCGRKGRIFNFYKFRSMVCDAEERKGSLRSRSDVPEPVFKIKNDPRVTPFGRFIRKYSLDELPQLFNVLLGDMSLVGPRPPLPEEVAKYDNWQIRRLDVRPGITGIWQARGRSDLSFYKWVKWDIWYIDHWSIGLDTQILLWTIPAVIKSKGAY